MLRKFLLTAVVLVGVVSTSLAHSQQASGQADEHVMPVSDRWTPWPWKYVQPFPWTDIQGLWKVEQDEFVSYFSFKIVVHKRTGLRQLQVKQYDGESCRILATGVGIENDRKVLAQMTSRSGMIYRVELTSFSEKDLLRSDITPIKGNIRTDGVVVLSMSTFDNPESSNKFHMQIAKISALMTQRPCMEDVRK